MPETGILHSVWTAQTSAIAVGTWFMLDGGAALVTGATFGPDLQVAAVLASAGATVLIKEVYVVRFAAEFCNRGLTGGSSDFDPADATAHSN